MYYFPLIIHPILIDFSQFLKVLKVTIIEANLSYIDKFVFDVLVWQ